MGKYVVFLMNGEEYAVDIQSVREITEYVEPNRIITAPWFIEGVINLRGSITPIVNLKKIMELEQSEVDNNTRIIIAKDHKDSKKSVGFVVDRAYRILTLTDDQLETPPDVVVNEERKYISAVAKVDGKLILVIERS